MKGTAVSEISVFKEVAIKNADETSNCPILKRMFHPPKKTLLSGFIFKCNE
jgi:hypothetical protein